ncbi:hypothetical protein BN1007_70603 [Klebsiella variicola]|nr:hypothetical protein BN1007_70603 [Klebsiella variicola]
MVTHFLFFIVYTCIPKSSYNYCFNICFTIYILNCFLVEIIT